MSSLLKNLALSSLAFFAFSVAAPSARAYDWHYSPAETESESFFNKFTDIHRWDVTLGAGAGYAPRYEGSDRYRFSVLPYFDFSFEHRLFFADMQGFGVTPLRGPNYHVAVSLGYDQGRYTSDDRKNLSGLRKVDSSFLGKISADYSFGPVIAAADFKGTMIGDFGDTIGFRLGTQQPLGQSWTVNGDAHTVWADHEHMKHFFSVTSAEAAASGKSAFEASSGFESFGFSLGAKYALTQAWALRGTLQTNWLVGDADKSPVSVDSFQSNGMMFVTYSF